MNVQQAQQPDIVITLSDEEARLLAVVLYGFRRWASVASRASAEVHRFSGQLAADIDSAREA